MYKVEKLKTKNQQVKLLLYMDESLVYEKLSNYKEEEKEGVHEFNFEIEM
jgi:hypothetical protein